MLHLTNLIGFGAGGKAPVTRTYEATAATGVSGGSVTFTGVAFGAAAANRYIVVALYLDGSGISMTGVTIGGITATAVVGSGNGTMAPSIWIAAVPTGTSGNVVATSTASPGTAEYGIAVYAMYSNGSATPSATGTSTASPPTATVAVPAGGVMIAVGTSTG